jgi:threonine/homoserine/homoserine lactone efflux protein
MLRAVGVLVGTAVIGVLALKLLGALLLPLLGMALGFVMFVLKLALIAFLIYMAFQFFRRWGAERGSEAS